MRGADEITPDGAVFTLTRGQMRAYLKVRNDGAMSTDGLRRSTVDWLVETGLVYEMTTGRIHLSDQAKATVLTCSRVHVAAKKKK